MKITNLIMWLFIGTAFCGKVEAQSSESFEFDSPNSAPIYVVEGDFLLSYRYDNIDYSLDWSCTMNPATGSLIGEGNFAFDGYFYYYGWQSINFAGSMRVALTAKQAGNVVRVNGKMALSGGGSIAGYTVSSLAITYTYTNIDIDPVLGLMSGYGSAKGRAIVPGYGSYPIKVPTTYISQELPDTDTNGEWDSTGEWTAEVDATVDAKGKIVGTGELTVWDEFGEAYDVIPQKVSGKLKNGVVTLSAAGNSKPTSKIKVNLTYLQSNDETVANKSSVSACGQNRKF